MIPRDTVSTTDSALVAYKNRALWVKTDTGWLQVGADIDTTSLSARIDQKLNISDTTGKWKPLGWFPGVSEVTGLQDSLSDRYTKAQLATPDQSRIHADNTRQYHAISSLANLVSNTSYSNGQVMLIGNSLATGDVGITSIDSSWFSLLQKEYKTVYPDTSSEIILNFGLYTRYALTITGTWGLAATGPVNKAITLQPGAKITFSGDYDYIDFFVNTSGSSGSLEVRYNSSLKKTFNANGATVLDSCTWSNTPLSGVGSGTWEISCTTNPVTITGLIRAKGQRKSRVFFSRAAVSGYSTSSFNNTTLLTSLRKVATGMNDSTYTTYIISLGANDTYNVSNATTPAVFAANLKNIFTQLLTGKKGRIIFAMEPKADESLYPPILAYTYEQYLERAYQACVEMGVQWIDMNKVGFLAKGLYSDGEHLNAEGNAVWLYNFLQESDNTPESNFSDRQNLAIGGNNADVYNEGASNYLSLITQPGKYATLNLIGDGASGSGELIMGTKLIRQAAVSTLGTSNLCFYTNPINSGTALTERMRILGSNGNVGINTITPGAKLDVVGNIRTNSYFQLDYNPGGVSYYWQAGAGYAELLEGTGSARVRLSGGMVGIFSGTPTSRLHVFGSTAAAITTVTGNTTLDATHSTVLVNNSGSVTITLPAAAGCPGRKYEIKKLSAASNDVLVDGNASETIDGGATKTLTLQNSSIIIRSNGTNWFIVGSHAAATTL